MFSVFRSSSVSSSGETLESVRIAFRLSSKDYNRRRSLRTVEPTDFRRANLRRRVVLTVKLSHRILEQMMKSRQNNERTDPKKGRTSAKSRTRSGKDLLADLNISASTGKVTQRPKPKTALPRVKISAQEPKKEKPPSRRLSSRRLTKAMTVKDWITFCFHSLKACRNL